MKQPDGVLDASQSLAAPTAMRLPKDMATAAVPATSSSSTRRRQARMGAGTMGASGMEMTKAPRSSQ